jgi:peptidyl-dipeptidase Dcp
MAATPDAAEALLMRVWTPAVARAEEEAAELQRLIDADGGGFALAAWDWRFYAERVRRERFSLDGAALKRHLRLEACAMRPSARPSGSTGFAFGRVPTFPAIMRLSTCGRSRARTGQSWAVLYTDYLARPTKHGGRVDGGVSACRSGWTAMSAPSSIPSPTSRAPPDPRDTPLSLDEARTLFHEFGHALHGLLSDVTYPSQSGRPWRATSSSFRASSWSTGSSMQRSCAGSACLRH